ncbi:MAG: hypothetical protein A2X94_02395 [Bdellovibrionales bacterium GWB1_55_8]|nr:MAG: hypothetical protein A2X94_02395 [Bdellovibrionales bacterium GWB1_55_8]
MFPEARKLCRIEFATLDDLEVNRSGSTKPQRGVREKLNRIGGTGIFRMEPVFRRVCRDKLFRLRLNGTLFPKQLGPAENLNDGVHIRTPP